MFSVAQITYPRASILFDLAIAVKCIGVATSYLIVFGGLMPCICHFFNPDLTGVWVDRRFWISLALIILLPLGFLKKLDSLRHTSAVALISVAYCVVVVVYYYLDPSMPHARSEDLTLFKFSPSVFSTLPVFIFAFTCHQNVNSLFCLYACTLVCRN
jgi:amino acid permease